MVIWDEFSDIQGRHFTIKDFGGSFYICRDWHYLGVNFSPVTSVFGIMYHVDVGLVLRASTMDTTGAKILWISDDIRCCCYMILPLKAGIVTKIIAGTPHMP